VDENETVAFNKAIERRFLGFGTGSTLKEGTKSCRKW